MARYDDLNTRAIAYGTFVSAISLLLIILVLRALCYEWVDSEARIRFGRAKYTESEQVLEQQRQLLEDYGTYEVELPPPPDQPDAKPTKEQRIRIPVERAAQLFLQELSQQQQRQAQRDRHESGEASS